MWLVGRSTFFSLPRPAVVSIRTLSSISLSREPPPCAAFDDAEFLPWLRRKSGVEISSSLKIGRSEYGRSLFASRFIEGGECILKIPHNAITPDKIFPRFNSLLGDNVSDIGRLALILLSEEKLGLASDWAPYIACLPQMGKLHCTIFWNKQEMELLRSSSVFHESVQNRNCIKKEFLALISALKDFTEMTGSLELEKFMHAYGVVGSRAWDATKQGLSLIPFADFFNHDGYSEACLLSDDDKEVSEVIADRNYAPGEEVGSVLISYGKFSNATLLLDFGFTLPYNPYDQVQLCVGLPQYDPLFSNKVELLHRHNMPTTSDTTGPDGARSSFTIKAVRSTDGRGFPPPLRAFARVLSATTCQELENMAAEAVKRDGRLARFPLGDKNKEVISHRFLLSKITDLIEEHISAISLLDTKCIGCYQFLHRRKLAKDLLNGELRILHSAASWLTHYCSTLSA
ncbi:fructose-bisphosphate aldolase-lysine N-methyltransferase, chloroplastic isoform X2 [Nymphaea colorata]|uniref:fructose-bisphosphate aldolase-lysine N-methyltransferase, chloroplastic isoform X2 n=1 Tax=Nymphaea colorata TaxID=210225 RepID=UPI00129EE7FF|nr:fructose-bisphosphate aldolase-lysine N-methyltransferase, chloroplastic isoform X2 [Nymphaea colorata]